MEKSGKIGQLILFPLFFQILIAVSIAANEYPFDKELVEYLQNLIANKIVYFTFDGTRAIDNADQPHTLKVEEANCKFMSISFHVIGENKFCVEPVIGGNDINRHDIKGPFSLENIKIEMDNTSVHLRLKFGNEDKKVLMFYGRIFTKSDDDDEDIGKYVIEQDPITIPQIESLMQTRSAEATMEWVKALIENPPSDRKWYNTFTGQLGFDTKPMLTTTDVTTKLLQLIQQEGNRVQTEK